MTLSRGRRQTRPATKKTNTGLYQARRSSSSTGWVCRSVQQTAALARQLVLAERAPSVWLLRGPLGSGKTTFVRAALRSLGYRGTVASPTFTLVRQYPLSRGRWRRAIHIDAYRITDRREEAALDIAAAVTDSSCLVFIEWPEKLRTQAWVGARVLRFAHRGHSRRIVLGQV